MRRASTAARQRQDKNRYLFVRFQQAAAAVALAENRADVARAALLLLDADDFADTSTATSYLATLRFPTPDLAAAIGAMHALSRLVPRRASALSPSR